MHRSKRFATYVLAAFGMFTLGVSISASAGVAEQVIHTFGTPPDGAFPLTKPFYLEGKFYGTTSSGGGGCNCGTVYELTPSATGWTYKTIYTFKGGSDGLVPLGNLVADASGNIYGVTGSGGDSSMGTVWELSAGSGGKWTHKVIYAFGEANNDGSGPNAGLIIDAAGNLYGTTFSGGANFFDGTVYELTLGSNGLWNEAILHSFSGPDGSAPEAEVVMDKKGNLYGTTKSGGTNSDGVVFKMTPISGGAWSEAVLYSFTGGQDQGFPEAPVWIDANGNLYGTTTGTENNILFGTVYELTRGSGGIWTETTLHTFVQDGVDGEVPAGGLTFDGKGNLYGTASEGGTDSSGTIYQLTRETGGAWNYDTLYAFPGGSKGAMPSTAVTLAGGQLFGVTTGGNSGSQVFYELKP